MSTMNGGNLPTVVTQETVVRETTKKKHWREIEIFTGVINTFISGFNLIGSFEHTKDNESEYIWLLLLTRSFHSLRCSVDLMLKGYYSQAVSVLRTGTEDWFLCTNATNTVVRKYLLRGKGKLPTYYDLAKTIPTSKVYGDYQFQSKFSHASLLSLRILQNPETHEIRIAPTYDEILFLSCAELFMRESLLMSEYMWHLLSFVDQDKAKSWDAENRQRIKATSTWLNELRDKYGGENGTGNIPPI